MKEKENAMLTFLSHNISFYTFLWILFLQRTNQGGVIGNWVKVKMYNKFFDVDIKVTIKRKPTFKEKQEFKEAYSLDLDEISERL